MEEKQIPQRKTRGRKFVSGSTIKFIALITMVIDHLGAAAVCPFFSNETTAYHICRLIGRISFPLFCFLLTEGFFYTSSKKRYFSRLFLFAVISEVPFDLAFYGKMVDVRTQNVFFTLALGLLTLCGIEASLRRERWDLVWLPVVTGGIAAWIFHTDYSYFGIVLIVIFYWFREIPWRRNIMAGLCCLWEPTAILALIPIQQYNGKRGVSLKYMFYLFYPVHLLLLWYLRVFLF